MIRRVLTPEHAAIAAMFADRLWPGHAAGELAQEMKALDIPMGDFEECILVKNGALYRYSCGSKAL